MKEDDPLDDFSHREITLDGVTKRVHVAGSGPAVIVMTEMPGISPHVARFSRWVRDAGFTVYMPSLFGRDGAVLSAEEGAAVFQRACVSAEFRAFAANESSPVTQWLRALARLSHQECGGPGVGAIGMCAVRWSARRVPPSFSSPKLDSWRIARRQRPGGWARPFAIAIRTWNWTRRGCSSKRTASSAPAPRLRRSI